MTRDICDYYCYRKTRDLNSFKKPKTGKIKVVLFDMDGVLTDTISSWKYIHDYFNTNNERSVDSYLKGEIDDMEFIKRDVSLWKQNGQMITQDKLKDILSNVPLMKGAKKSVRFLNENNIKTVIVSAGLDILAVDVAKRLGIDEVFANGIKIDADGRLTGEGVLGVKLMYKDEVVRDLAKKLNVSLGNIASVGNSCFDIPMFENCGLGLAFNPEDDCVRKAADVVVEGKDLSLILPYLNKHI